MDFHHTNFIEILDDLAKTEYGPYGPGKTGKMDLDPSEWKKHMKIYMYLEKKKPVPVLEAWYSYKMVSQNTVSKSDISICWRQLVTSKSR